MDFKTPLCGDLGIPFVGGLSTLRYSRTHCWRCQVNVAAGYGYLREFTQIIFFIYCLGDFTEGAEPLATSPFNMRNMMFRGFHRRNRSAVSIISRVLCWAS